MRKNLVIVMLVMVFSVMAYAGQRAPLYQFPTEIMKLDKKVVSLHNRLVREGYTLQEEREQPIFYFMAPYSTHTWGVIVRTYAHPYPGKIKTPQVDYATVTVTIQSVLEGGEMLEDGTINPGTFLGFRRIGISTTETTVY